MIRVLQVIGSLNSGGSQSLIMNIYRNIDLKNMQFDFIIDRKNDLLYADEINKMGGKIYVLPQYKVYNVISYKKAWHKFFKTHPEYKVIHGHVRSTASIYLKIAKKYGLYTIAHSHSISSGKGIKALIKNLLQYKIRYVADYFIGCSEKANEWLFGKKIANSNKCMVLNNGIDIEKFKFSEEKRKKIRNELNINDDTMVIGHVGRFSKVKNHTFLLDIFHEYLKVNNNSLLLLVGTGPLEEDIKKKANELNLSDKIKFLGTRHDTDYLYCAFDCLVFPSLYEGIPLTLIEAQANGLPIVASNNVDKNIKILKIIEFKNLREISNWVDGINKFYKKNREINLSKIKESGYDIQNQAKKLESFYNNIIKEFV